LIEGWGLKAVGWGNKVTLNVAEQGRVSTFPIEFRLSFQKRIVVFFIYFLIKPN